MCPILNANWRQLQIHQHTEWGQTKRGHQVKGEALSIVDCFSV